MEIAAVESEMRAIDGIGFFNWRPDYQKKAELAMQKKELEEELENNSRLEIVLGCVFACSYSQSLDFIPQMHFDEALRPGTLPACSFESLAESSLPRLTCTWP